MDFQLEYIDSFGNSEKVFWLKADKVTNDMVVIAKEIDRENYSRDCFGVCIVYTDGKYNFIQRNKESEFYYIDNNGEKHWLPYKLSYQEKQKAINICKSNLIMQ